MWWKRQLALRVQNPKYDKELHALKQLESLRQGYPLNTNNFSNNLNISFKDGSFYPNYLIKYDNKYLKNLSNEVELNDNFEFNNNFIFLLKRIGDIPN